MKTFKWLFFFSALLCAVLLGAEGFRLWQMGSYVDGAGIGVYFLFFEINDRAAAQDIPFYAGIFFAASAVVLLLSVLPFNKKVQGYLSEVF
ncbi:hypothetical protein [Planomicrobium sp. YIM 101495]|uniref:hypothetical protein n=1 Tax=Planomicrobium sp. YIM 101495 TaxID=2665160 RepID=UPI0012B7CFCF|nr:hypothetical protein [Planomicrobium sp. YIM 101495]MTD31261.1 hypothetical protein [Planomicrobium sp. YIM 101495]